MKLRSLLFAVLLLPAPALAQTRQFANGEAVSLAPDTGYVLVRTFQRQGPALSGTVKFTPVLIRVLSSEEIGRAKALADADPRHWTDKVEPNVVEMLADRPYGEQNGEVYLIAALKPGTYVLAGVAVTNWAMNSTGVITTSLCMGTVEFEVKPGVLTDMGAMVNAADDKPTAIPELAGLVTGKQFGFSFTPEAVALRPATPATEMPQALRALPVAAADYRAAAAFPNYFGAPLSRLAPLPGVLDYDKDGNVLDLKAAPH